MPDDSGLGLSGAMRLERIEITVDRTNDKLDRLGDEVHAALNELAIVRSDSLELSKRVRSLELKFYGILAGIITALAVLIYNRGGV